MNNKNHGSGRSKFGYYKGIFCGSTYELCWVIYSIDHNVEFSRFPTILRGDDVNYIPDFLLGDGKTIIEIKGYEHDDKVLRKTRLAEQCGYSVIVLRKNDLTDVFRYVTVTYGTKKYETLYDDYKPKYSFICDYCFSNYETDRKPSKKSKNKFCSRVCAGKYHIKTVDPAKINDAENGKYKRQLTKEQALVIFWDNSNRTYEELGKDYGVSRNAVWWIKAKKSYKWIHN
jgi:hypothetical protein